MNGPLLPKEIERAARAVALTRELSVASDTHYDAGNLELQWWSGNVLHRLDLQPMPEGNVVVTAFWDCYPLFGRAMRWAWNFIPMVPYIAQTQYRELGKMEPPYEEEMLMVELHRYLADLRIP
ncbi:MAG: hypothetical protein IPG20_09470 [Gammaproteobacteria bacterium]|jgi:hypothetical protein|nr:hypothetical protein [Gammaproteobacteria bacterium]MBK6583108.1 hypothetical protein [Gammaproteobacteria bacterium]